MKLHQITEGTWALPSSPEQKAELTKLLSTKLTANQAKSALYSLVGDDILFDALDQVQDQDPFMDVRDLVKNHLTRLGVDGYKAPVMEGPLDFIKGASQLAANKAGNAIKQSSVVKTGVDLVQAGKLASASADISKLVQQLGMLVSKHKPLTPPTQPTTEPQKQSPTQQVGSSEFTPNTKPKMVAGQYGPQFKFEQFLIQLHDRSQPIDEGVWDFIKGATSAGASKLNNALTKYAERPSVFKDIYHAGKAASAKANDQAAQAEVLKGQQMINQHISMITQQVAKLGQQGQQAMVSAVDKLPANVKQEVRQLLGIK